MSRQAPHPVQEKPRQGARDLEAMTGAAGMPDLRDSGALVAEGCEKGMCKVLHMQGVWGGRPPGVKVHDVRHALLPQRIRYVQH